MKIGLGALLLTFGTLGLAAAQEAATDAPQTQSAETVVSGWGTQCQSQMRSAKANCAMEQRVILKANRQQLARITITVPGETKKPMLAIVLPLRINLESGFEFQIDDQSAQTLKLRSCDGNGCFMTIPLSDGTLDKMKAGGKLKISFQDLTGDKITVTAPLTGFSKAYDAIS